MKVYKTILQILLLTLIVSVISSVIFSILASRYPTIEMYQTIGNWSILVMVVLFAFSVFKAFIDWITDGIRNMYN